MTGIADIIGREILDSRGNPTVEVDVIARRRRDGPRGACRRAPPPARTKPIEKRDGEPDRYLGKGVRDAVEAVSGEIANAILGMDAEDQRRIDTMLIELDGTREQSPPRRQRHPRRFARGGEGRRGKRGRSRSFAISAACRRACCRVR